jgi:hypothetical protein
VGYYWVLSGLSLGYPIRRIYFEDQLGVLIFTAGTNIVVEAVFLSITSRVTSGSNSEIKIEIINREVKVTGNVQSAPGAFPVTGQGQNA